MRDLERIHDCKLLRMTYEPKDDGRRSLHLLISCPDDLGYEPWDGQNLQIMLSDVAALRCTAWGISTGPETIDAIRFGVSDVLLRETERSKLAGIRFPTLQMLFALHSGSQIEVIADRYDLLVVGS